MSIIKPTVGRKIWFFEDAAHFNASGYGADGKGHGVQGGRQPYSAEIVSVQNDRRVNVVYFSPTGELRGHLHLRLLQTGDVIPKDGDPFCCWMPYQTGQSVSASAVVERVEKLEQEKLEKGSHYGRSPDELTARLIYPNDHRGAIIEAKDALIHKLEEALRIERSACRLNGEQAKRFLDQFNEIEAALNEAGIDGAGPFERRVRHVISKFKDGAAQLEAAVSERKLAENERNLVNMECQAFRRQRADIERFLASAGFDQPDKPLYERVAYAVNLTRAANEHGAKLAEDYEAARVAQVTAGVVPGLSLADAISHLRSLLDSRVAACEAQRIRADAAEQAVNVTSIGRALAPLDIAKHPLLRQAYAVCIAIENLGASAVLTEVGGMANRLMDAIDMTLFPEGYEKLAPASRGDGGGGAGIPGGLVPE